MRMEAHDSNQYRDGLKPSAAPVYNSRIRHMLTWARPSLFAFVLPFFVLALSARAEPLWQASAGQLAQKIAAVTGPTAVAFEIANRSSLNRADVDSIRQALVADFLGLGIHIVAADQSSAFVQISLSENLQGYVWVAEIHQGTNPPVAVIVALSRSALAGSPQGPVLPGIIKTFLLDDENRILDLAILSGSPQRIVVLSAEWVLLYSLQNGHWQQNQVLPIAHSRPWPRDLRGRIVLRPDHLFDVYLPGTFCRAAAAAPISLACSQRDDPWPLGAADINLNAFFAPSRNFFTGALSPGVGRQTSTSAFYSAAPIPREKYTLWVFSATDGHIHLLDGVNDQIAGSLAWGSDLAGVRSNCGRGWQILATSRNDGPDRVTAYEVADRDFAVASQPADFNGPITALWTESDSGNAIAVSKNIQTERYEAYRLSVACSH